MKYLANSKIKAIGNRSESVARGRILSALLTLFVFFVAVQTATANTYNVSVTTDTGGGSLRDAITQANSNAGADTITFSASISKIAPASALPPITDTLTIDGRSGGTGTTPGVELSGESVGNVVGLRIAASNCTITGLVVNRFGNAGIRIDTGAFNTVSFSYIGTDLSGTAATLTSGTTTTNTGNVNYGILIVGSTGNTINGNVISGNFGTGIGITTGGSATITGNFIGTDKNGMVDLGNTREGILIAESSNSIIGGSTVAARNVISGNNSDGIYISQSAPPAAGNAPSATNNIIRGNYIGVDATGAGLDTFGISTVGNSGSGIAIQAGGNRVGGSSAAARNVISGNRANGISLGTAAASANTITGNYIGVAADGATVVRNRLNGVQIGGLAFGNVVGFADSPVGTCSNSCNLIANNGDAPTFPTTGTDAPTSARAGIYVDATGGNKNTIRGNRVFNNTGIGIDLDAVGATANDTGDPDTGANDVQNTPTLTAADSNGVITGTIDSTAATIFSIDFYANDATDAAGSEGRTYIGSTTVDTMFGNNFRFNTTATVATGQIITATATNNSPALSGFGDTSEFAATQTATAAMTTEPNGLEADIAPNGNGNGIIESGDVLRIQNLLSNAATLNTATNEFQRADSAPVRTQGDGVLNAGDVLQAQRYLENSDTKQNAGGPTTAGGSFAGSASSGISDGGAKSANGITAPAAVMRAVRVQNTNATRGSTVDIAVLIDANGDEAGYSFTLNYDDAVLTNPTLVSTKAGGSPSFNFGVSGRISGGVSFFGGPVANGVGQTLVVFRFTVSPNAAGTSSVFFNDTPTVRSISDSGGNTFTNPVFTDGTVTFVAAPTAAAVTVKGRVTAKGRAVAGVRVSMTDASGKVRVAATSSFGYYQFTNVPAGETYVFKATARRYEFPAQVVDVNEDVNNLNFSGH